jgi:hypothetical protein
MAMTVPVESESESGNPNAMIAQSNQGPFQDLRQ